MLSVCFFLPIILWKLSPSISLSGISMYIFAEATFEVLPRLNEIKFGSGVIDELLFLDLPRECRFPSGIMMLEYGKAVQESVYEQLRVVREGQLRIVFTHDLKVNKGSNLKLSIVNLHILPIICSVFMFCRYCLGNFVLCGMKNFFLVGWLHHRY